MVLREVDKTPTGCNVSILNIHPRFVIGAEPVPEDSDMYKVGARTKLLLEDMEEDEIYVMESLLSPADTAVSQEVLHGA